MLFFLFLLISVHAVSAYSLPSSQSGIFNDDDMMSCILQYSPAASFIKPNTTQYDNYRMGTNFRYDNFYPSFILSAGSIEDIQAGVKCASKLSVEIVIMNGGHSFEGLSGTNSLLVELDNFNEMLSFDFTSATVTVQSGIRLARLYGLVINSTQSQRGETLVIGGGTCPTVGVSGHVLCGGYGLLGRQVGLTSDQIVGFQVVSPNGILLNVNSDENPDIFWALRGSCSSAFGVIATITFRLLKLDSPDITIIKVPDLPFASAPTMGVVVQFVDWWQRWASLRAPQALTSALSFNTDSFRFQFVYLGGKEAALRDTLEDLWEGFRLMNMTREQLFESYATGTFLDAVVWWTDDDSLQTVDDFMAVTTLPPVESRSSSRRKAKSLLAVKPLSREGIQHILDLRMSKELNQVEMKAYSYPVLGEGREYTDDRSPLLRGHLIEMHYGNSYHAEEGENTAEKDAALVTAVNAIGESLVPYFPRSFAYPGYIDRDLDSPGREYFGELNGKRLSRLKKETDPEGVLSSPASDYLYP
jgi:hypothetical protein